MKAIEDDRFSNKFKEKKKSSQLPTYLDMIDI